MFATLLFSLAAAADLICAQYSTSFADTDAPGFPTDIYGTNGTKPAPGVRVRVVRVTGGPTLQADAVADLNSADVGCATFTNLQSGTYAVTVLARATINGHTLSVKNSLNDLTWAEVVTNNTQTGFGTVTVTLTSQAHWNTLAAASRAIARNNGGRANLNINLYTPNNGVLTTPASCGGEPCVRGTSIYLSTYGANRRFAVAHSVGWALLHDMGWDILALNVNKDDSDCGPSAAGGLGLDAIEHTHAAYLEGFAHYYAASTFNYTNEADCGYVYWRKANWDQLGEPCFEVWESNPGHGMSCATGAAPLPFPDLVASKNQRLVCEERSPGARLGEGMVPVDVMRFTWEMVNTNPGYSRVSVAQSFASATNLTPSLFLASLRSSALTAGVPAATWDAAMLAHGVD